MSADLIIVLTAVLVAIPCALLGTLLVLRQMSMMGDAISHAVLPGIVIAFFISESLGALTSLIGAGVFGLLTAVLVEALRNTGRVKEDSSIGIVFTALFALGVFLVSKFAREVHLDLNHVLYGEIAFAPLNALIVGGVDLGPRSLWAMGLVTTLTVGMILLLYKELKIATFDPGLAAAVGLSPVLVHYLLMGAVSVATVGAFDSVGAIVVVAFLIVPPATAYLLTEHLSRMMALAVLLGAGSAVAGYYLAAVLDVAIAGMMAVVAGGIFMLALLFSPSRGLIATLRRQRRNRRSFARGLLLAKLAGLGDRTTEEELANHLGWAGDDLSKALRGASRAGLISRSGVGVVVLTKEGQATAHRVAESNAAAR
ncbi:MAG: Mn-Zn_transporter_SitD [uncultured Rubrobacteraceae bacterium]|uniref:Mn-Zn_transporter_SitD n=1 Tax=uncultured Rubrobacteraceae bacterium TaxID=349277 RepID=A0A6J4QZ48_9ACTN|nr:MAG: Mn-Zn_transporter_SitD [uncultured Rubrobacteraceae bacterium]